MKTMTIHAAAAVAILVSGGALFAQSPLAEAARREAARRQGVRDGAVPVYTNADIDRLPERAAPVRPRLPSGETTVTTAGVGGDTVDAQAPGAAPQAPAVDVSPRADEKTWRARITTARSNLSRAQIFAEALQSRVNALTVDFTNRDDPAQRQQLFEQRQQALAELSRVQGEIAAFTQEIADIEEDARRLGVPPGWLR
ncbi:MAG: hypothetical protein M3Q55_00355 [Acidobacteriota bacterium]|nr:hypothetical protein [Acidobacteriota bacterium]